MMLHLYYYRTTPSKQRCPIGIQNQQQISTRVSGSSSYRVLCAFILLNDAHSLGGGPTGESRLTCRALQARCMPGTPGGCLRPAAVARAWSPERYWAAETQGELQPQPVQPRQRQHRQAPAARGGGPPEWSNGAVLEPPHGRTCAVAVAPRRGGTLIRHPPLPFVLHQKHS
jgi:hypothetical protein